MSRYHNPKRDRHIGREQNVTQQQQTSFITHYNSVVTGQLYKFVAPANGVIVKSMLSVDEINNGEQATIEISVDGQTRTAQVTKGRNSLSAKFKVMENLPVRIAVPDKELYGVFLSLTYKTKE